MTEPRTNPLTYAFLDREPRSAARVLEELQPRDAAAFLERAPARLVAPAVSAMIPWSAARCVEEMKAVSASSLLEALEYSDAVSILRLVDDTVRDQVLDLSSRRFARQFRNSLSYPKDTVGAWMDVSVPSFQETAVVKDAVRTIRRMKSVNSHIFLTDAERRFAGLVAISDLLHRDERAALSEIADTSVRPLSNRDSVAACSARTEWDHWTLLPVVGRKSNLLGGLSRGNLRKAMLDQDTSIRLATPGSVLMQLLTAFGVVGAAFANLTLLQDDGHSVPKTKEVKRGRKRKNRGQ